MRHSGVMIWGGLLVLAVADVVGCRAFGIVFHHWLPFLAINGAIAAVGLIYGLSRRSKEIAGMAKGVLLWMLLSLLGAILTYVAAAAQGGRLFDPELAAADAALGFDWAAWSLYISAHPWLQLPLGLAYTSLLPQIVLSVVWFSYRGREHRNTELLVNGAVAMLLTTAVFYLVPALGPGIEVSALRQAYIDQLVTLRGHVIPPVDLMQLKGVIAFPSFHAVLAVLFVHAHRRSVLFIPALLLNGLMLLAIPSEGGHYLIDLFFGVAIAGLTVAATTAFARPRLPPYRLPAAMTGHVVVVGGEGAYAGGRAVGAGQIDLSGG